VSETSGITSAMLIFRFPIQFSPTISLKIARIVSPDAHANFGVVVNNYVIELYGITSRDS